MSLGVRLIASAGVFLLIVAVALQMWGESGRYTVHPQALVSAIRGVAVTAVLLIAAGVLLEFA